MCLETPVVVRICIHKELILIFQILLLEVFDQIYFGMVNQVAEGWDASFANAIRNHLFDTEGTGGLDLVAFNIQRGRDHGIKGL